MPDELLTIQQLCEAANIGRTYAYQLINSGQIKAVKLGRKTMIQRAAMQEWLMGLDPYKPTKDR